MTVRTRFAPSPTGFLHLGVFFTAMVNRLTASASDGVFYFRLEDTDKKREVAGGAEDILTGLNAYGLTIDEGFVAPGEVRGAYGPYQQSERVAIYQCYVKSLVEKGLAYPCFCTEEQRQAVREQQEEAKQRTGYYGAYAPCRSLSPEEALERVRAGASYVVRLRSPGSEENRVKFDDMIKGTIEMPENDEDLVLLKSDGVPTYHFAHAVDDHLMRTTHVVRGDEWLPSLPFHIQLFQALGFKLPKYVHIGPLMKMDGSSKRKLSKRKDPELALTYYKAEGFPIPSVREYIMTVLNSNFEDWRRANPDAPVDNFKFSYKKMNPAGSLFDYDKLHDVSKNVISRMDAERVYREVTEWAAEYDKELYDHLTADEAYAKAILAIGRGGKKPRKDFATWVDVKPYLDFFYDDWFRIADEYPEGTDKADVKKALALFAETYDERDEMDVWFDKIKAIADTLGYASDMKAYKENPGAYRGNVADVSMFLRVAVTGKLNSPDMYAVMQVLGRARVLARVEEMQKAL